MNPGCGVKSAPGNPTAVRNVNRYLYRERCGEEEERKEEI
jgi:hypothetical protein